MHGVHGSLFALLLMLATPLATPLAAQTATTEVPDTAQPDVVMIAPDRSAPTGTVIRVNPQLCRQIGPACDFMLTRAHCQLLLGQETAKDRQPLQAQRAADQCAALNAPAQAVLAMWSMLRAEPDGAHGPDKDKPQDRAHRICAFALQTGNWSGPAPCP